VPCTSDLFGNISVPVLGLWFGVWLKSKSQVEPRSVNVDVLSFTAVFGYSMMFLLWMRRCWAEMARAQSSRLSYSADGSFAALRMRWTNVILHCSPARAMMPVDLSEPVSSRLIHSQHCDKECVQ
jgi:hypothetical protein